MDQRIKKLAYNLVNHSIKAQAGERVYINYIGNETTDLVKAIIEEVYKVGALPFPNNEDPEILRALLMNCTKEQWELRAKLDVAEMKEMDCFIGVRAPKNSTELADVPADKMELYEKYYMEPVHHGVRVPDTRWVVLRYPTAAFAQAMETSLEAFEDFYFEVCTYDYSKMSDAMKPLQDLMERTDKVRIVGPGTDLTFSIKDIPVIPCAGELNIPDGEVYTAPVRDSINGVLHYNTPSVFNGFTYEDITLTFENGKIINATANNTEKINAVFNTDEGARYVGEFAIGVNPFITKPLKETLFDEKIMGSFHFTPGNCYKEAPNGNHSAIHWDLVCIQTPEYGGGEIYFDDVLIRKDGRFVLPELDCLNPENMK